MPLGWLCHDGDAERTDGISGQTDGHSAHRYYDIGTVDARLDQTSLRALGTLFAFLGWVSRTGLSGGVDELAFSGTQVSP